MILSPEKNDKFDKASDYKAKAKVLFGKGVGDAIGLAYEQYLKQNDSKNLQFKDIVLFKFSRCKEFYDKFLKNCDAFHEKDLAEKSSVFLNFLLQHIPAGWVQDQCNYNSSQNIEDESVEIKGTIYNINEIDILATKLTVQAVHKKYTYEEINLNPDFQRNEIWTLEQKSLLIESLLINIPIPAFYIDARISGKWNVIDGLQRLSTIMSFTNDGFALSELEYLELKGKKFSTLDRKYQRRIEDYELTFNLIRHGTPTDVAFNIFTRINTLGTPLSAQEIRHAMNMGTATDLLKELAATPQFIQAISEKNHKSLSKRMNDKALILRYLSFKLLGYYKKDSFDETGYSKNDMNAFLIKGMETLNKLDYKHNEQDGNEYEKLKQDFIDSMQKSYIIFKEKCFRKFYETKDDKLAPINIPLFETIAFTVEKYSVEEIEKHKDQLFNEFLHLFIEKETDENIITGKFLDWITTATNNIDHVKKRFDKVQEVFRKTIGY